MPIAKVISGHPRESLYLSSEKRGHHIRKKRGEQSITITGNYLDDVLIEDDVRNVNLLFNRGVEIPVVRLEDNKSPYMLEFTPR